MVEALEPRPEADVVVWDTVLPGFGVRLKPSGVRSYIAQYRNEHGRSRRATLGKHGQLTLHQAREQARQMLASTKTGADPVADRKATRVAPTMNDLLDRYLTDHVERHNRPRTQAEFRRLVEKHIRPAIGNLKVAGVRRDDIYQLHFELRETPRLANSVLSVLSKAFNLAELWEMRQESSNPVRLIKRYPERSRERFFTDQELARLGAVLDGVEQEGSEHPSVTAAIRLLALTGCRLSEIISLRWDDIDREGARLRIREGKSGGRWHTVGSRTVSFLDSIPLQTSNPWVLPHTNPKMHLPDYTLKKAWRRLRLAADLGDLRLHDLRHTVGTYAGQTGANEYLVRDKLGHATTAMTSRYVNFDHEPVRQLSDLVEERVWNSLATNKII